MIGVDCLGFDLRVCSGTQVQTLRFAFPTKVCHAWHSMSLLNYVKEQLRKKITETS